MGLNTMHAYIGGFTCLVNVSVAIRTGCQMWLLVKYSLVPFMQASVVYAGTSAAHC